MRWGHNYGICKKCGKEHIHPKGMKGKSNKGVHLGSIPWNKGLTKETDGRVKKMSEIPKTKEVIERVRRKNKGKKRTEKQKKNISNAHKGQKSHRKGLTMEEEYGKERALKMKEQLSNILKQKHQDPLYKHIIRNNPNIPGLIKNAFDLESIAALELEKYFVFAFYPSAICDRIVINENGIHFVEVKSGGRRLSSKQLLFSNLVKKYNLPHIFYNVVHNSKEVKNI